MRTQQRSSYGNICRLQVNSALPLLGDIKQSGQRGWFGGRGLASVILKAPSNSSLKGGKPLALQLMKLGLQACHQNSTQLLPEKEAFSGLVTSCKGTGIAGKHHAF